MISTLTKAVDAPHNFWSKHTFLLDQSTQVLSSTIFSICLKKHIAPRGEQCAFSFLTINIPL
jgi:hypothetical protein